MNELNAKPTTILVTGGSSGLGRAIIQQLLMNGTPNVINFSMHEPDREMLGEIFYRGDITDAGQVEELFNVLDDNKTIVDTLVNCAGINWLSPLEDMDEDHWDRVMNTNARSILTMTRTFLPHLKFRKGTVLNIVSNASHMPMTHSSAYNASKGAAHILTLQLARELTKAYGITVFGISPAKIANTSMSRYIDETVPALRGWTPEEARDYQLKGLLTGEEVPAENIGEFIAYLLSRRNRNKFLSGCILPYGA